MIGFRYSVPSLTPIGCCYEVSFFRNPFAPDLEGVEKETERVEGPFLARSFPAKGSDSAERWRESLRGGRIDSFKGPVRSGLTKQPRGDARTENSNPS